MVWKRLDDPRFGLANRTSDAIATLEWREPGSLVDLRQSPELLLVCDFAGTHSAARYEAFGFLLGAISHAGPWMLQREVVRERLLTGRGEMSYKGLNDVRRQRALAPFLETADLFPANLVVVLVSKKLRRLFDNPGDGVLFPELIVAVRHWNRKSFHRLLLVAIGRELVEFRRFAASYEILVDLVTCLGAIILVQRAVWLKEYFWAAGFAVIAVVFSPLLLVVKVFLLMGFICIATLLTLVVAGSQLSLRHP